MNEELIFYIQLGETDTKKHKELEKFPPFIEESDDEGNSSFEEERAGFIRDELEEERLAYLEFLEKIEEAERKLQEELRLNNKKRKEISSALRTHGFFQERNSSPPTPISDEKAQKFI